MNEFEGTLVVTLRLPIKLRAAHRDDATERMLAMIADARSNGIQESARLEDLVAVLAPADPHAAIPVRRIATDREELCQDATRVLRRPLDQPVWHAFEARSGVHVGSGRDPEELWAAASGRDVASFRTALPEPWRAPAWEAASAHARSAERPRISSGSCRNEFLRGVRCALDLAGPPLWSFNHRRPDAYHGFQWARDRMEELDTPEHQRLVELEVAGEIPVARMRSFYSGTVYAFGGADGVPGNVTHSLWRCLWQALHRLPGSANRWALRRVQTASDEALLAGVAQELGTARYGYSGPHGSWDTRPADQDQGAGGPVFMQGIMPAAARATETQWRYTLRGAELVRHARALLSVPDPTGRVPEVRLPEEALNELLRLAGRSESTPAARAGRRHGRAPTPAAEPPVAAAALTLF